MNAGSIQNEETVAACVYFALKEREGQEWDAWELSQVIRTTCLSTRISEVRKQLPANERIETRRAKDERGRPRWFYRLVVDEVKDVAA